VAQTQQVRSILNGVGTPVVVQLPVATENAAGVMPAASFSQIQANTQDIARLKSQTGGVRLGSFATKADLDAFVLPDGAKAGDNAIVRDDETQGDVTTSYALIDTSGGVLSWDFDFVVNYDPIGIATTTTPGLSLSSEEDGQVQYENDGTGSVNGWDALKQSVTNTETELLEKVSTSDMEGALAEKQNTLTAGDNITISGDVISATGGAKTFAIATPTVDGSKEFVVFENDRIQILSSITKQSNYYFYGIKVRNKSANNIYLNIRGLGTNYDGTATGAWVLPTAVNPNGEISMTGNSARIFLNALISTSGTLGGSPLDMVRFEALVDSDYKYQAVIVTPISL
jgi:hypothetical protein